MLAEGRDEATIENSAAYIEHGGKDLLGSPLVVGPR
jgi:hypothetical protein